MGQFDRRENEWRLRGDLSRRDATPVVLQKIDNQGDRACGRSGYCDFPCSRMRAEGVGWYEVADEPRSHDHHPGRDKSGPHGGSIRRVVMSDASVLVKDIIAAQHQASRRVNNHIGDRLRYPFSASSSNFISFHPPITSVGR